MQIPSETRVARAKAGNAGLRRDPEKVRQAMKKAAATRRRRALGNDFLENFFAEIRKRGDGWLGRLLFPEGSR
jgi:chorismate mutase